MISRHEASVGQAPVERREAERERNLMRPDGESEREREREGEVKNAHDLTAQGTGASRTMPFKNFVLDPPSRNFFSPSSSPLPSFCDVGPPPLPLARSLARSLARPRIQNNVPTLHRRVLLLRHSSIANRRDQLAIILFAAEILPASGET